MPMPKPSTTPAPEGRYFMAVAPYAWGRGKTEAEAVKNCKANYSRSLGGPFRYVLFDVHEQTTLDEMGSFCYYPDRIPEGQTAYTEVKRVGKFD